MPRFTPKDITCAFCEKVFRVTQKVFENRKYCSTACYHAYEAKHGGHGVVPRIEFKCARCETPFFFEPGQLRSYQKAHGKDPLYCSRDCAWIEKRKLAGNPCIVCGKETPVEWTPSKDGGRTPRTAGRRRTLCSSECRKINKQRKAAIHRPLEDRQITRQVTKQGYIRIRFPGGMGIRGREVLEHRYVMEEALGRPLTDLETVHHINGRRDDNRLDNLSLRSGNHGPGGEVSAMIKWAHEFIALYPQFDAAGNFTPVDAPTIDH